MKKLILSLILLLFTGALCAGGYLTFKGYNYYKEALEGKSLEEMALEIRSIDNYTTIDDLPEMYKNAVISVEDKRFYDHNGIDLIAIARALYHDIKAGSFIEGGSTITQQLAKNQYFSQEKDITRKIAEVFMAFDIEKTFTKDEILELYVNSIYFGDGYYCVADASEGYFHKPPKEMNDDEATLLAGVPNAPSVYAPTVNPELARERQKQVILQMIDCGYFEDSSVSTTIKTDGHNPLHDLSISLLVTKVQYPDASIGVLDFNIYKKKY